MKTTITLLNKTFTVSEKLVKEGVRFPNTDVHDQTRHNQFKVTIKGDAGRVSFDYYDSGFNNQAGKVSMDEKDLKGAVDCFLRDAMTGGDSFEYFCDEMGYDTDSRAAEKIYKACVRYYKKAIKLFDDVPAAAEQISELAYAHGQEL